MKNEEKVGQLMCSDEVDCEKRILVVGEGIATLVSSDFSDVGWEECSSIP